MSTSRLQSSFAGSERIAAMLLERVMPDLTNKEPDLVKLLEGADADKKLEGLRIAYGPRNTRARALLIAALASFTWSVYHLLKALF